MLSLKDVSYLHPDKDVLFTHLNLNIAARQKVAIAGLNGVGKSTLLKIMAGKLLPISGVVTAENSPYYVPQVYGQFNHCTVAEALQIDRKLAALREISSGEMSEENLEILNDDWTIEDRAIQALQYWQLTDIDLRRDMSTLSGGQKTRVCLAGIQIHDPEILLLDEPSNHLDDSARQILNDFVDSFKGTLIIVSHDRNLLNSVNTIFELEAGKINIYGGNYEFYQQRKSIERQALDENVRAKEKTLRKAKETERESIERQQKLDARGKKRQEKAGLPTISMNTFRNNAEKSTAKLKHAHQGKIDSIADEIHILRNEIPDMDKMKLDFDQSQLHNGKQLVTAQSINHSYDTETVWKESFDLDIISGDRIALIGDNGSGKTTLINIILGKCSPSQGKITIAAIRYIYIDQDYSLINDSLTVYEQAQQFNESNIQPHEVNIRLHRFLFKKNDWDKACNTLSGGEKMRLLLCCLTISNAARDLLVLDEPTNNLDINSIEILTNAINSYKGTLLVVSHDRIFRESIGIKREIKL